MLTLAYFSPTHTSRRIAEAVGQGMASSGEGLVVVDVTRNAADAVHLRATDRLVVSVPVYGGKVAPIALQRLAALRGEDTPAIALVVYGNRDCGTAPAELAAYLRERGFVVVAAGAFVGEHSYSTPTTPIAAGRPSVDDLAEAEHLGRAVAVKLATGQPTAIGADRLKAPKNALWHTLSFVAFVLRHRRRMKKHPVVILPRVDTARCNGCGRCARHCPTEAISADAPTTTQADRCIRCAACVKGCPTGARTLQTPFAPVLARHFHLQKSNVTLL